MSAALYIFRMLLLRPCGLNTPHTHPRATEFLYVISGTALEVGFVEENGARYVNNTVFPGQATLFPKGSIHFQANLGCEPLQFVAALNNIDPGVLSGKMCSNSSFWSSS